jgi:hypothetical protein
MTYAEEMIDDIEQSLQPDLPFVTVCATYFDRKKLYFRGTNRANPLRGTGCAG